jgi:activator of HSP90 ATPase
MLLCTLYLVLYTFQMKNYKKYFIFETLPEYVYNALVNPVLIEVWTNSEVVMSEEPGSEFSLYDGDISGRNIAFEKNKKIVQEWYFDNPEGQESIVTIKLHVDKKGTSFELNHTNIPDEAYDDIVEGWSYGYIDAIRAIIEE